MVTKINIFSSLFVILSIISLNHTIFSYHNIQNQYRNNLIKQRSIDKNRQLILLHQQNNSDDYIQKAPSRCIIKKVPNSDCIRAFEYCQNLEGKLKQKDCLVDLLGTAFPGSNKKGKVDPLYWRKLTEVYRQIKYQEKGQVTKETLKERIGIYTAETAEVDIITSTTEKTITTTVKPLTTTRKPPTTISKYSHNHSSDSQESNGKTPEFKNHPAYLLNLKQRIQQAFTRVLMDLSTKFPVVADAFRETIRKRLDGNITENELIKNITLQKNFFEKHPEWMGKLKIIQMQFGMLGKEIQEIESKGREEYQKANETAMNAHQLSALKTLISELSKQHYQAAKMLEKFLPENRNNLTEVERNETLKFRKEFFERHPEWHKKFIDFRKSQMNGVNFRGIN